jgi:hypothetical protein
MNHELKVTRRDFLRRGGGAAVFSWVMASGLGRFVPVAEGAPRKLPGQVFNQQEARLLLAMARTIFPHDFLADDYYLRAVAAIDQKASHDSQTAAMVRGGLGRLGKGFALLPEREREKALRAIEQSPFFAFVRGETLQNLYGQPEVWKIFGFEGAAVDPRSFDDIDWLPND